MGRGRRGGIAIGGIPVGERFVRQVLLLENFVEVWEGNSGLCLAIRLW